MGTQFDGKLSGYSMPDSKALMESADHSDDKSTGASLFESAYEKTADYVKSQPAAALAITAIAAGGLYYLTRGRGAAVAEVVKEFRPAAAVEFTAGQGALRTLEGAAIPNVTRAAIGEGALTANAEAFAQQVQVAREGYGGDLVRLWTQSGMPRTVVGLEGETGLSLAERVLKSRAAITTEKITPELIGKEVSRLTELNEGFSAGLNVSGKTFTAWNEEHLKKAAADLQFKHVPQLGQFLKGTGKISEEQIEAALKIQRAIAADQPRKLIGQILVENNLAAQADVDLAFGRQQEMKAALTSLRDKFLQTLPERR